LDWNKRKLGLSVVRGTYLKIDFELLEPGRENSKISALADLCGTLRPGRERYGERSRTLFSGGTNQWATSYFVFALKTLATKPLVSQRLLSCLKVSLFCAVKYLSKL
jgi:hypothetical protein